MRGIGVVNMMHRMTLRMVCVLMLGTAVGPVSAQRYGEPDRQAPGDAAIQTYLADRARAMDASFADDLTSLEVWQTKLTEWRQEYLEMLGLWPLPPRTPLEAKVTGTLEGDGYIIEKLHYQSMPGLYVTGNLYRPARIEPGAKLPAIFYVCGHSMMGRNGNKTAYQTNGIWFARHGYVCLVVDSLQLGEIAGVHHGTYREGRWWWVSRGYTPAGVECWNGIRGIDYLSSRPDVDPERIGVTGISGGGAATFWIAAADERVRAAAPVSAMADLESYVGNLTVNGHCDCMFLHNAHRWPWTRIAGLIAPRPLLFVNSDADPIFPMDANERVIARLERLYSLFGASDRVDAVVSVGGHAYREDIRKAVYRFFNTYLKGDASPVVDSEVDVVSESGNAKVYPIALESLRVFPTDDDFPADRRNAEIDRSFVAMAEPGVPTAETFDNWKATLVKPLARIVRTEREPTTAAPLVSETDGKTVELSIETEPGLRIPLELLRGSGQGKDEGRVFLIVTKDDGAMDNDLNAHVEQAAGAGEPIFRIVPRGGGRTRWTQKNPPNYVDRAHLLLGDTTDAGRVRDVIAAAQNLAVHDGHRRTVVLVGEGASGVLAAVAAVLEPSSIGGVIALKPPSSLMDEGAPVLLNALRSLDVTEILGLTAPRPLTIQGGGTSLRERLRTIYGVAGAAEALELK